MNLETFAQLRLHPYSHTRTTYGILALASSLHSQVKVSLLSGVVFPLDRLLIVLPCAMVCYVRVSMPVSLQFVACRQLTGKLFCSPIMFLFSNSRIQSLIDGDVVFDDVGHKTMVSKM